MLRKQARPVESSFWNPHRSLLHELVRAQHRAGELGMFRSLHKIEDALREAGFELADMIEGKQVSSTGDSDAND